MHFLRRFWKHPWTAAVCNIALLMLIYSLMRVFLYFFFPHLYRGTSAPHVVEMMLGGLRFDLTAILYLSSGYLLLTLLPLPEFIRNSTVFFYVEKLLFYIPNALGIIINCVDMPYIPFSGRRMTSAVFHEFAHDKNIGEIILQGMGDYWFVTLFGILMLVALWHFFRRPMLPIAPNRKKYYIIETAFLFISAYFIVIGIRGGFGRWTRPLGISNAMQYVNRPGETSLVLNTPFTLMMSVEHNAYAYQDPHYFQRGQLDFICSPIHDPGNDKVTFMKQKPNVVIIILESFATEHIGFYNRNLDGGTYQGFTPNLDSILARSVTFEYSYASGRKSIDAMPSTLSSIPMLIEPYITTPYSTNHVSSIPDVLGYYGYYSAFFHGAPNGSMGFQAYARSAHFKDYFGLTEYYQDPHTDNHAFDGTWAIWDEEFLEYFAHKMGHLPQPFCTAVFTASSHHPFRLPSRYENRFPAGPQKLCRCIAYSDYALGKFFEIASKEPYFDNTLFVITADHTSQLYHDEYQNEEGLFRVPIAFYMPALLKPRYDHTQVVSQIDIMPSILDFLGVEETYFAFGQNALTAKKRNNYAVCFNYPNYQIMGLNGSIQFDGKDVYHADETLSENERKLMLRYLQAFIQQYITRMIDNHLTVDEKDK